MFFFLAEATCYDIRPVTVRQTYKHITQPDITRWEAWRQSSYDNIMSTYVSCMKDIILATTYGKVAPMSILQYAEGSPGLYLKWGYPSDRIVIWIKFLHRIGGRESRLTESSGHANINIVTEIGKEGKSSSSLRV
ncbi:hypothetical protein N7470_003129 [Penicillium chermesinum]|nr:hypothetical protein N7470_003129 [Penicillium chermesinum]